MLDPTLSARHVTDSAQRILNQIPARAGDRSLFILDNATFVTMALWSLLRWERKVGLVTLERMGTDLDSLTHCLDRSLTQNAQQNQVAVNRQGVLVRVKTDEPYKYWDWDFRALLEPLLTQAEHEALAMHHDYVGSEHLLLAIVQMADAELTEILKRHGVTYGGAKTAVLDVLGQ